MSRYDLVIERTQPPCGGKAPRLYEFHSVETDDPCAYVRDHEPDLPRGTELDYIQGDDNSYTIVFEKGAQKVRYEFSED